MGNVVETEVSREDIEKRIESGLKVHRENNWMQRRRSSLSFRKLRPASVDKPEQPLGIQKVDFLPTQNAEKHHTIMYDCVKIQEIPVFRRGYSFFVEARFSRPYVKMADVIIVLLQFGKEPDISKGTEVAIVAENKPKFKHHKVWEARVAAFEEETLAMEVQIPASAMVGSWKCTIATSHVTQSGGFQISETKKLFILFNPWCLGDPVKMDPLLLHEYVLNQRGKIYKRGTAVPWYFGQFDDAVLPSVLYLLEKYQLPYDQWGNPVLMCRALAAMLNSSDEKGLLFGTWTGDSLGGSVPVYWTSSIDIYKSYIQHFSEDTPVKFGQFWVFSGCLVTACRAIGIPSRAVTCLEAGYDMDGDFLVRLYETPFGKEIVKGKDSRRNFHVWTEAWMARPDIGNFYNGWQALDPTPQAIFNGKYQCGPASVKAIKNGEVNLRYDTDFFFAEVNADCILEVLDPNNLEHTLSRRIYTNMMGSKILTKKPNVYTMDLSDAENIVLDYKYEEGSLETRTTMKKAMQLKKVKETPGLKNTCKQDEVEFSVEKASSIQYGEDVVYTLRIKNKTIGPHRVQLYASVKSVYLIGGDAHVFEEVEMVLDVGSHKEEYFKIGVKVDEYVTKVPDDIIRAHFYAKVIGTKIAWNCLKETLLEKPEVHLQVDNVPRKGQWYHLVMSFKNPLDVKLNQCVFEINIGGIGTTERMYRNVYPKEAVCVTKQFPATFSGPVFFIVTFNSKEIQNVCGSLTVEVLE